MSATAKVLQFPTLSTGGGDGAGEAAAFLLALVLESRAFAHVVAGSINDKTLREPENAALAAKIDKHREMARQIINASVGHVLQG